MDVAFNCASFEECLKEFAGEDTADMLRADVARPKYIAWDSPCPRSRPEYSHYQHCDAVAGADGRELGYVLSLGSLGEAWRAAVPFGM